MKSFRFHVVVCETMSGEPSLPYKLHITVCRQTRGMRHITLQRADADREKMKLGYWKSTGLQVHWEYFIFFSI